MLICYANYDKLYILDWISHLEVIFLTPTVIGSVDQLFLLTNTQVFYILLKKPITLQEVNDHSVLYFYGCNYIKAFI